MRAERNILSREVFPKLKELCLSKDLDFQVVDMRWGVTEDSQNDHSVERICLQEVENCQQMSLGPNFVVRSLTISVSHCHITLLQCFKDKLF